MTETSDESLIVQIREGSTSARREAARKLGRKGVSEAIPELFRALQREKGGIQEEYREAITEIGGSEAIREAISLLESEDPGVRNQGVNLLKDIGGDDPNEILRLLDDRNEDLVIFACEILASLEYEPAREQFHSLLEHPDENVRDQAIQGLKIIGNKDSLEKLSEFLGGDHTVLTFSAIKAIGAINGKRGEGILVDFLRDSSSMVRPFLIKTLGEMEEEGAIEPLISMLTDVCDRSRSAAIQVLTTTFPVQLSQRLSEEFRSTFAAFLLDEIREERVEGVELFEVFDQLAEANSELLVEVARSFSERDDTVVKIAAAKGLHQMRHPDASELLREMASDSDPAVQNAVGKILEDHDREENGS